MQAETIERAHLRSLLDDMSRSPDPHTRVWGLISKSLFAPLLKESAVTLEAACLSSTDSVSRSVSNLIVAHPDDLFVQWTGAATFCDPAKAMAIANVQRLEGDNAAAWALSLDWGQPDISSILRKMAASRRYDEHLGERLKPWLAAMRRHPLPHDTIQHAASAMRTSSGLTIDVAAAFADQNFALMMSRSTSIGDALGLLLRACQRKRLADASHRKACIATGHLMLGANNTLAASMIGEALLREADALDPVERTLARRISWWQYEVGKLRIGVQFPTYLSDYASSDSEVEAFRRAAGRAGKEDPPEGWKSAAELPEAEHQELSPEYQD